MNQSQIIFSRRHLFSSIIMILALAWLTVSLPFVNAMQQVVKQQAEKLQGYTASDDCTNTPTNTTEEKTGSSNALSEYLHHTQLMDQQITTLITYYKCHADDVYYAFHPKLISPPPKA